MAELVGWVTIPEPGPGQNKSEVKQAYLRRLRDAPPRARLVKLADRASNVQTLRNLAPDRQRSYFAQTVTRISSRWPGRTRGSPGGTRRGSGTSPT